MDDIINKRVLESLGKQIKDLRLQKGLRQNEVAEQCGFYKSGYNAIEAGKRNISITTLYKIALVLEAPISHFFKDEDFFELLKA